MICPPFEMANAALLSMVAHLTTSIKPFGLAFGSIIPDDLVTMLAGLKSLFHQCRHARCLVFSGDKVFSFLSRQLFC